MVEFEICLNPKTRTAYIPKELANTLGAKVRAVGNRVAVLLFPEGMALSDVIRSLELIKDDLEHAQELGQK